MKKIYSVILILVFLGQYAVGQSISINYVYEACWGNTQRISLNTSGTFNADNQLSVQVKQNGSDKILSERPAVYRNGNVEVLHDTLLSGTPNLMLRVVASSPKTESQWVSFRITYKGQITLLGAVSDTINHGDQLQLRYAVSSQSYINVTLNDSSRHSVSYSGNGLYYTNIATNYRGEGSVFIAHAENNCGAVNISGQVNPVINPVSLRPVSSIPAAVCEESEVKVAFSAQGTPFSNQTKFRLRFIPANQNGSQLPRTVEVDATLRDNLIVAQIPGTFQISESTTYRVQIISELPALVSSPSEFFLYVHPKPGAEFTSSSGTIDIGSSFYASIKFTGQPPFSAELQDGTILSSDYNSAYAYLMPERTTSYQIKSFSTGCGHFSEPGKQMLVVRVNPGITVKQNPTARIFCLGEKVQLPFMSNYDFNNSTQYFVNLQTSWNSQIRLEATRNGNLLEFTPPTHLPDGSAASYESLSSVSISTTSPASQSNAAYVNFTIQSKPDIYAAYNFVFANPGRQSLSFGLKGRGPMTIEEMDGTKIEVNDSYWYKELFLNNNTEFKIKSIANSCFRNDSPTPIPITVNTGGNLTAIHIDNTRSTICTGDSVEISFLTSGAFSEGNTFTIQGYSDCCTYKDLAVVNSGGKFKIKLPEPQYSNSYAYVRVASSNPVFFSDNVVINTQRLPTNVTVNPESSPIAPYSYYEEGTNISIYNNGGYLKSVTYNNGSEDLQQNMNLNQTGLRISSPMGVTVPYTIKSVTNACGTTEVNKTVYVQRAPYRITPAYVNSEIPFCPGLPFGMTFTTSYGSPGVNTRFSLQMFKEGATDITTLVKDQTQRYFEGLIPAGTSEGVYYLRIISSDGAISENRRITIGSTPGATLSATTPQPVSLTYGQSVELKTTFTGSGPWTLIYQDGSKYTGYSNPISQYVRPEKSQDYEIKGIYNSCGYGTATGKVSVKIKPSLTVTTDHSNVCQGATFNVSYQVFGDAELGNDYVRFELIENNGKQVIVLDSTRTLAGKRALRIPEVLSGSSYSIRATIRSLDVEYRTYVNVAMKAHLVISGNNVVNAGDPSTLTIRNTRLSSYGDIVKFRLSDGSTNQLNYSSNFAMTVAPNQTTTYSISSVENSCGSGTMSGSAIITVNPPASRTVKVNGLERKNAASNCIGDTLLIRFETAGTFTTGNIFTVQISDTTGLTFRNIATIGNSSPLSAVIPLDLVVGKDYRVRVVASDPNTGSSAFSQPVVFSAKAKARFASESVLYDGKQNPKIVVLLEGGNYWQYQFGTDINIQYRSTSNKSDTITLFQASPNQYYKLFSVRNECGVGIIENPSTVRVEVITAEPGPVVSKIVVAPNPALDVLRVKYHSQERKKVSLFDKTGQLLQSFESRKEEDEVDVRSWATGIYILKVEISGKTDTFKIIKP